jgi:hypothetical protein
MDHKQKQGAQIFGLAGALVVALLLSRKKPATAMAAAVSITVLDESGNEIPHNSPVDLDAGGSYTVSVTVINQSTLQGQPTAAILITSVGAMVDFVPPLISDTRTDNYEAGESRIFTYSLQVPDIEPCTGQIRAIILDPNMNELAAATLDFNVLIPVPPIVYAASVDVGVVPQ